MYIYSICAFFKSHELARNNCFKLSDFGSQGISSILKGLRNDTMHIRS